MPRSRAAATPALLEMPLSTVMISAGRALRREADNLGREPVTEFEAVGHQEIHRRETPGSQAAHDERRAGGAISVEVSDHDDAPIAMREDQPHRGVHSFERAHGHEAIERERKFVAVAHAARGISAPKHGVESRVRDLPGQFRRVTTRSMARIMREIRASCASRARTSRRVDPTTRRPCR